MSTNREKTFGTELRRIRRDAGKTLEDVGAIMGVSIPHVSDIERERRSPPPRTMIAKILGAWGRMAELDNLAELAMRFRGEFQRAPKNATEHRVLVGLERALDNDPSEDDYEQLLELLTKIGGKNNV